MPHPEPVTVDHAAEAENLFTTLHELVRHPLGPSREHVEDLAHTLLLADREQPDRPVELDPGQDATIVGIAMELAVHLLARADEMGSAELAHGSK